MRRRARRRPRSSSGEPGVGKTRLAAELRGAAHDEGRDRALRPVRRGPRRPVPAVRRGAAPPTSPAAPTTMLRRAARRVRRRARPPRARSSPRGPEPARAAAAPTPRPSGTGCSRRSPRWLVGDRGRRARWCSCSTTCTGRPSRRCCCSATSCAACRRSAPAGRSAPTATPTSTAATRSPRCSPTCAARPTSSGSSLHAASTPTRSPSSWRPPPATSSTTTALELARAVHAETEGNPFFVGEVLRHLAETGASSGSRTAGGWPATAVAGRHPRGRARGHRPAPRRNSATTPTTCSRWPRSSGASSTAGC